MIINKLISKNHIESSVDDLILKGIVLYSMKAKNILVFISCVLT